MVNVALGPVRGSFNGESGHHRRPIPFQSYRLSLSGNSNIGFGSGDSLVTLEEADGRTTVTGGDPGPGRRHSGPGGPANDGKRGPGHAGQVLFVFAGDGGAGVGGRQKVRKPHPENRF